MRPQPNTSNTYLGNLLRESTFQYRNREDLSQFLLQLSNGSIKDSWSEIIEREVNSCVDNKDKLRLRDSILILRISGPKFDNLSLNQTNIFNFPKDFYTWAALATLNKMDMLFQK